jgi:dsRNA-specific ribonuclease
MYSSSDKYIDGWLPLAVTGTHLASTVRALLCAFYNNAGIMRAWYELVARIFHSCINRNERQMVGNARQSAMHIFMRPESNALS